MDGRSIKRVHVNRSDLRMPLPDGFAARLAGRTVIRIGRRAKYLVIECDDDTILLAHLGMSGRMLIDPGGKLSEAGRLIGQYAHGAVGAGLHEHIVFELNDGTLVRFIDPRRFGLMTLTRTQELAAHPLLAHLGPEPMAADFTGPRLANLLRGKRTPIKAALLDQRVVAGLGNIYVCESLFLAGISPRRLASTVTGQRAARLVASIQQILAEAIEAGGSTLRDHVAPSGEIGYFQHRFKVYGREGMRCPVCDCDGSIRRIVQSNRSTYYCSMRQR